MKVVNSIMQVYSQQYDINDKLKIKVDGLLSDLKDKQWHYVSRIKNAESFALKLETGRVGEPDKLEDFFACTIVVENIGAIKRAKALVKQHFNITHERPDNDSFTRKESSSFIFDDLRLYVVLKPTIARAKGPLNNIVFEIQIKTFLQHAWSIATHDLVYKSDQISWTKQRVAYQVKAMLENAEVSIEKADSVKSLRGIPSDNPKVNFQNKIMSFVQRQFEKSQLPSDMVRLIGNIEVLLKVLHLKLEDIEDYLNKETLLGKGTNTLNLSPYLIVLQSVINQKSVVVNRFIKKRRNNDFAPKLFIPNEIDVHLISMNLPSENVVR